ncbi:MAG: lyase family protein [Thermoleophilia bacterium]
MSEASLTRAEHDALGEVEVPADALWGVHTQRGLGNFPIGGPVTRDEPAVILALAWTKAAAARANAELGVIPRDVAAAIVEAAHELVEGRWHDHFPVTLLQGGGYTTLNMNANEVLANRASELLGGERGAYDRVHPNDHVNRSQSTNDAIPTALALAAVSLGLRTVDDLAHLEATLRAKAGEAGELVRIGRTCIQDAVPLRAADGLLASASALARTGGDLRCSLDELLAVPIGATAIGTGIGAPAGYRQHVVRALAEESGLPVNADADLFDGLQHLDPYVRVASDLVRAMLVVAKLANDLRFLSSGPVGGIGELRLPAVQAGSSIMPGKVNPVMPELVMLASFEARGAATVVECAVAAGEQELNVWEPAITTSLLPALRRSGEAVRLFADRCVAGIAWNADRAAANLGGSFGDAVERAATEGYSAVARERYAGT